MKKAAKQKGSWSLQDLYNEGGISTFEDILKRIL